MPMREPAASDVKHYQLRSTAEIRVTSERGDRLSVLENMSFREGTSAGNVIHIHPQIKKQRLLGIGSSFTESSAFVLAHLNREKRKEVMNAAFSAQGANFSFCRTVIGACDFSVEGRWSYADRNDDVDLNSFDISPDLDGFDPERYSGIRDAGFDLLPMIKEAQEIKAVQKEDDLRIVASAWTAPAWMKDIEDWYIAGSGGRLKPEYETTYADYLVKYLDAYKTAGVPIWGITPVNEPLGNNGQWESMHFTPHSQNEFIKDHLGPKLRERDHSAVKLLIFDHSRDQLEQWVDVIYNDPRTAEYVDGAAVHWYESTFRVYDEVFERVHEKHPQYSIIHTEGCIDSLGVDAPEGVLDPDGYKESNWFDNDDFWWNDNATDWAYTATWPGVNADDHPKYAPVHRYARNIIESFNHRVSGWIDWNLVLDANGGPNHVGNYCGAPFMVDTASGYVYYTPVFYVLAQLSRTIRPGDRVVESNLVLVENAADQLYACATISDANLITVQVLNTSKQPVDLSIQVGSQYLNFTIVANTLQTFRFLLPTCPEFN